jgi:RES domain-containing protein
MNVPKLRRIDQTATHRLIPYHYSDRGRPILNLIAQDNEELLSDLIELEGATNDRLLGESGRLPGITTIELVSGFRFAHVVNASFTHANPSGGRFNGPERGAWYAGFHMATAQAEVAFHRAKWLRESAWSELDISQYIDYQADFSYEFHDIRSDAAFAKCLHPDSYNFSQALGRELLMTGSAGIVYPSVRHPAGVCIACFRPPLVLSVREGVKVTFTFINQQLTAVIVVG